MYSSEEAPSSRLSDIEIDFLYDCHRERGFILKALQHARIQFQLAINTIDTVATALRSGLTDADAAMAWLHDEGVLKFLDLDPPAPAAEQEAA